EIVFRAVEGRGYALARVREDGTSLERLTAVPGYVFGSASPDGRWVGYYSSTTGLALLSATSGEPPIRVFAGQTSRLRWSADGSRLYLSVQSGEPSAFAVGRTYMI